MAKLGRLAASGAVGTFSGVNADSHNEAGELSRRIISADPARAP